MTYLGILHNLEGLMSRGKLLVKQVKHLVVVDLEIGAFDDENTFLAPLSALNLLEQFL